MYALISIIILLVCILLVLVVLVQNSKGGGLAANFAGSNQVMGVRKTADFLEKATWSLAAGLIVLSVLASWTIKKPGDIGKSKLSTDSAIEAPAAQSPITNDMFETPAEVSEEAPEE